MGSCHFELLTKSSTGPHQKFCQNIDEKPLLHTGTLLSMVTTCKANAQAMATTARDTLKRFFENVSSEYSEFAFRKTFKRKTLEPGHEVLHSRLMFLTFYRTSSCQIRLHIHIYRSDLCERNCCSYAVRLA